jgi:hypothetical protein
MASFFVAIDQWSHSAKSFASAKYRAEEIKPLILTAA